MKGLIKIELDVICGALCNCLSQGDKDSGVKDDFFTKKKECEKFCCGKYSFPSYKWVTPNKHERGHEPETFECPMKYFTKYLE